MRYFKFYINAEGYTYTATFRNIMIENDECIITSDLRHSDFAGIVDGFSRSCGGDEQCTPVVDFERDFQSFTTLLNNRSRLLDQNLLDDILLLICKKHIQTHGKLSYIDLLMYMDVYIHVVQAIFDKPLTTYHSIYKKAVCLALSTYPKNIIFQDMSDGTCSLADFR